MVQNLMRQNDKMNLLVSFGWFELFFAENDRIVTEMFGSVRSNCQFTETCSKKIAHTDLRLNLKTLVCVNVPRSTIILLLARRKSA